MEYQNPPHTSIYAGMFSLGPNASPRFVESFSNNRIQKKPVCKDCIDVNVGLSWTGSELQDSNLGENMAYISFDYGMEFKINGVAVDYLAYSNYSGAGIKKASLTDCKFYYARSALPEGAEGFFSDCTVSPTGILVTWKRIDSRNGPNEDFTVSQEEISREEKTATIEFSSVGENYADAPQLNYVFEECEYEYDVAVISGVSYTYLKKLTSTFASVFPNEASIPDVSPGSVPSGGTLMQFAIPNRTFFA